MFDELSGYGSNTIASGFSSKVDDYTSWLQSGEHLANYYQAFQGSKQS